MNTTAVKEIYRSMEAIADRLAREVVSGEVSDETLEDLESEAGFVVGNDDAVFWLTPNGSVYGFTSITPDDTIEVEVALNSELCPVCGDTPDYCQGHGEIGDPAGFSTLAKHDGGDHSNCHPVAKAQGVCS